MTFSRGDVRHFFTCFNSANRTLLFGDKSLHLIIVLPIALLVVELLQFAYKFTNPKNQQIFLELMLVLSAAFYDRTTTVRLFVTCALANCSWLAGA